MHKFMETVGHILALVGLVCIVKHLMHPQEGCVLCGWKKTEEKEEKRTGSRYGSSPVRY